MYERLEECPVCKHKALVNKLIAKDHLVSQESFAIVECQKCQLLFTNPRPTLEQLPKYYQSEDYVSHTNKSNNLINIVYKAARYFTIRSKYKLINKYQNKGSILDYGCGTGDLLKHFNKNDWKTTGVEPDPNARKIAIEKNNLEVYESHKELNKGKTYDVIMLWHVMEHIYDLKKTARKLVRLLSDKGTMIIAVPNHKSLDAEHYKENWAAYDVPRHLYHFNQLNIKELFRIMKVKLVKIHPMTLDAYYVSLLSEKNISKSNNFLEAIKIGNKSNKLAKINNQNFSSLIYVVKK